MQVQMNKVRVFVASPGDVRSERDALSNVINELNLTISTLAPEKGIAVELLKWETHAFPGMGRVQGIINDQIGPYDIFVGIMWKRFGTPTGISESGTEEEFELAYTQWEKTKKIPHIMFYFCQAPSAPPKSKEDAEQLAKVVAFRGRLSEKGLVWEYQDHSSFADTIRPHLIQVLGKLFPVTESPKEIAQKVGTLALYSEVSVVRKHALKLAHEYEQIRATMPSGSARTRKMEAVMAQMKNLAPMIYPLLLSFAESDSPGQRLVAIAILQGVPTPEYLGWLADRLAKDRPFIGYHAAVALLIAVRTLHFSHFDILAQAIEDAIKALGEQSQDSDRGRILENAEKELARYRQTTSRENPRFLKVKRAISSLLAEMRQDLINDKTGIIRELVVLPNDRVPFWSDKKRFNYYEEKHPDLKIQIDLLQNQGHIIDVTPKNTPIYRMTEELVDFLLSSDPLV